MVHRIMEILRVNLQFCAPAALDSWQQCKQMQIGHTSAVFRVDPLSLQVDFFFENGSVDQDFKFYETELF